MELVGRYTPLKEIARGGMGVVHAAAAPDGRRVALKLLLAGREATPIQRRRFETEARALLQVRHPNVVPLLDAGEHQGAPFLALLWIEGESLRARVEREGPLDPRAAAELVRRLALALEHCHARGVIHRDLAPGNVLLRRGDSEPLLTDFGLARDVVAGDATSLRTRTGQFLGTPGFWAPEQVRGEQARVGPQSDVYGLGALLYFALTGMRAQEGETLGELMAALDRPPASPGSRRPGVPAWLDAACLTALANEPEQRFPGAAALAEALLRGLVQRRTRRGRGAVWAAALPLLAVVALTAAGLWSARTAADPPAIVTTQAQPATVATPIAALIAEALAEPEVLARLAALDRLVDRRGGEAEPWVARAELRAQLNRREDALRDLDQALALAPDHATALIGRGMLRMRTGDLDGSLADFERGIPLASAKRDVYLGHLGRGQVLTARGELAAAEADLDRAVSLAPRVSEALMTRATLRLKRKDLTGGLADMDAVIELEPENPFVWLTRAAARANTGRSADALADLATAEWLDPKVSATHLERARLLEAAGDLPGALRSLDRALGLLPEGAGARTTAARREKLSATLGPEGSAITRAASLTRRAYGLVGRDGAAALASFDEAVKLDPEALPAIAGRGHALATLRRQDEATAAFDRALALAPLDHETRLVRAMARAARGDGSGARADLALLSRLPVPTRWADALAQLRRGLESR